MKKEGSATTKIRAPIIRVIGVGGGGCNAVTRMVREGLSGVDFVAVNTDARALSLAEAPTRIQLGEQGVGGDGAGGDPAVGLKAAIESRDSILHAVHGADMVFIAAGMGGGTGTGATPFIAEIARDSHILTVAVVTRPFHFEGSRRMQVAEEGIAQLMAKCDALIVVPNERLLQVSEDGTPLDDTFKLTDQVLYQTVAAISGFITVQGIVNIDFASVRSILKDAGPAWLSVGIGTGKHKALEAADRAVSNALLDATLRGATGVLFNVTGCGHLSLHDVDKVGQVISTAVGPQAKVIFGLTVDHQLEGQVKVTLLATGVRAGPRANPNL